MTATEAFLQGMSLAVEHAESQARLLTSDLAIGAGIVARNLRENYTKLALDMAPKPSRFDVVEFVLAKMARGVQ